MIWSKQQQQTNESSYSPIKTLKPFKDSYEINNLVFIHDRGLNCLVSYCYNENRIVLYKNVLNEEEEEQLEHEGVELLIRMSNGIFASGGDNGRLNIWAPSSSPLF